MVGDEARDGVTANEVRGLEGPAMEEAIVLSLMSFREGIALPSSFQHIACARIFPSHLFGNNTPSPVSVSGW